MTKIKLSNVSKSYQIGTELVHALQNISLEIEEGEFLAIVGPSGSGKSTLLHMIGGLDTPTEGTIEVDGLDLGKQNDKKLSAYRSKKIGYIFQDFKLQAHLTAEENVGIPQLFFKGKIDRQPQAMLKKVDLANRLHHKPTELSGGQRQRVAIARALINKPDIIIADEPTGNLDSLTGKNIIDLLKKIHKEEGITLIVVTHDQNIAKHADRIVEIKDGILKKENNFKKFMN